MKRCMLNENTDELFYWNKFGYKPSHYNLFNNELLFKRHINEDICEVMTLNKKLFYALKKDLTL